MIRFTRYTAPVFALLAVLLLVRCGKDSPTKPQQPPAPARTTATQDAGSAATAGSVLDAGSAATVGSVSDTGSAATVGSVSDTGSAATAGSVSDAAVVSETSSESDRAALVALYNATNGSGWTNNENWLSELPLGQWHGVRLNLEGRVFHVELDRNNLRGSIPSEIGQLDKLNNLSLRGNQLSGALPIELGQVKTLTRLDLGENQLTGSLPYDVFGELANLGVLDLQRNQFTGSVPTGLATNMWYLALGGNALTGPIPPELGQLSTLRLLHLGSNNLSGTIPPELGRLSSLNSLWLSNNLGLSGALPSSLLNLSLQLFYINGTGVCVPSTAEFRAWLNTIEQQFAAICGEMDIEALTALYNATGGPNWTNSENWVGDAPLNDWYGVTTDETGAVLGLDLANNNLQGVLPPEIADLTNLKSLNLSGNDGLAGRLPYKLAELGLAYLNLDGTGICVQTDADLQEWLNSIPDRTVADCVQLDTDALVALVGLYTSAGGKNWRNNKNWLSQAPLAAWYGVTADADGRVIELDLSDNNLSGSLPSNLSKLEELQKINLRGNAGLLGPLPESLTGLSISSLNLEGTGVCVPSSSGFRSWLNEIGGKSGVVDCTEVHPDWEALVTLYTETNGSNWNDNTHWLSAEPLDEWFGVLTDSGGRVTSLALPGNNLLGLLPAALGNLEKLEYLELGGNQLSGPIPRELGNLENLRVLSLWGCWISGTIPSEIGRLAKLEKLNLTRNGSTLAGTLPTELGQLTNLNSLALGGNGLSGSIPPSIGRLTKLRELFLWGNDFTGSIPREIGQLTELRVMDLVYTPLSGSLPVELGRLTNLERLLLFDNELTGSIPVQIGQMTNLKELRLGNNKLTGVIPGTLSRMTSLETLDLSNNRLSGAVPPELGKTPALKELALTGNTELVGTLPIELTQLNLETLMLGETGVCAPGDAEFQNWLRFVQNSRVVSCAVPLEATAYLTQVSQSLDHPVPLVAGEDALLRVFLKAGEDIDIPMPPVRASFYQRGHVVYVADSPGEATSVPDAFDEGVLTATANVRVPGAVVASGMEVVIEIDPDRTLDPELGITRRIPEQGRIALDVRELPAFDLTMVPYLWVDGPDHTVLSEVDGLTPESDLMRPTRDLLPVNDFQLTVHAPVWTSVDPVSDNVAVLGPELEAIYAVEGATGYYMGIFRLQGPRGGLLGIAADIPSYLSLSVLDPFVIAHELGHNLNLFHAPCGGAGGPDPHYPYDDGSIGVSGYDMNNESLVSPRTWDLMSYCEPMWISDYSFTRALAHRMRLGEVIPPAFTAAKGLLLWGGLDEDGELTLEPAFLVDAPLKLPEADGPYTIIGTSDNGSVLFSLSFAISEYADAEGGSFAFILPVRETWSGSLDRISLSGPTGFAEIDDEGDQYMALMRDEATGEVRGILRDWLDPSGTSVAGRRTAPEPGMEITVSGGIPDQW